MKTVRNLFLLLLFFAGSASASTIYRAIGATCTDSNHSLIRTTEPGNYVVGPKVCADDVVIEITMRHDYVPGSSIFDCWGSRISTCYSAEHFVESFLIFDGVYLDSLDFLADPNFDRIISGTLPETAGLGDLSVRTAYSSFQQNVDGTWSLRVEQTVVAGECHIGSIEGPIPGSGFCREIGIPSAYSADGTIESWQRIPEPASLMLIALGLGLQRVVRKTGAK